MRRTAIESKDLRAMMISQFRVAVRGLRCSPNVTVSRTEFKKKRGELNVTVLEVVELAQAWTFDGFRDISLPV